MEVLESSTVAVCAGLGQYAQTPPFSPHEAYPEYPFDGAPLSSENNSGYQGVRQALHLLGYDDRHWGTHAWNPLGWMIKPGQTIVLKPNFIRHFRETLHGHDDCLITHGSIIRAALDYAYIALEGQGRIVIADAPQCEADFEAITRMAGLAHIQQFYKTNADFTVEILDLRPERAIKSNGVIVGHRPLHGDPMGYVKVDLGQRSAFYEVQDLCRLLYGSEYDTREIRHHHQDGRHEYLISRTVLSADCVIGLGKLKTHKKTALTVGMKNLVGINGNKNWLPHYREGTPGRGGDQFADDRVKNRLERRTVALFKRLFPLLGPLRTMLAKPIKSVGGKIFGDTHKDRIRSGNWYGNDTTWRMVVDLNRILVYADANGAVHDHPVGRYFNVIDGIVAGEGNGPMDATPRAAGVIIAGPSALAVDLACAKLMGFDFERIPLLREACRPHELPLLTCDIEEITVRSDDLQYSGPVTRRSRCLAFEAPMGWRGYVEVAGRTDVKVVARTDTLRFPKGAEAPPLRRGRGLQAESTKEIRDQDAVCQSLGLNEPLDGVLGWIERTVVRGIVSILLLTVGVIARLGRACRGSTQRSKHGRKIKVLVVGTFYNLNWMRSHIFPLVAAQNVGQVIVVCPEAVLQQPPFTYDCPPGWLGRIVGSSIAKVLWFFVAVARHRPDIVVGYHMIPNSLLSLVAAGLWDCKAIYQMTGGPVQLIGGGWISENPLMSRLGRPSPVLERWMFQVASLFDSVVVRGSKARGFLRKNQIGREVTVITGSVDTDRFSPNGNCVEYDLVTVGRLVPVKRPMLFLEIVQALMEHRPDTRAGVVGSGPLLDGLQAAAVKMGIAERVDFLGRVDDVPSVLRKSRLFVLTSANEGVSIAMLEAMSAGTVIAVSDVGECRDFIVPGRTGGLIEPTRARETAQTLAALLGDDTECARQSHAVRETIIRTSSLAAIAARWEHLFAVLMGRLAPTMYEGDKLTMKDCGQHVGKCESVTQQHGASSHSECFVESTV